MPTTSEEAEINRGIELDPDTWVPSDADWARAKRLAEVDPALAAALRTGDRSAVAKQYHVLPRGEEWAVRRVGQRISEIFATKSEAVAHARKLAKASKTEWVEYRRDGTVRDIHRPTADRGRNGRHAHP
jgi:hypothetical protein